MSARAENLAGLLDGAGADLMLVTAPDNVRYLTGYTGSNGIALVGPQMRLFVTDFRYVEQAAEEVDGGFERRIAPQDLLEDVPEVLPDEPLRLGFEESDLTVRQHARLRELLPDRLQLIAVEPLVESLRLIKGPEEIAAIRDASRLADTALTRLLEGGLVGHTERELAIELERLMVAEGAKRPSFDSIVAAGPHGALPHAQPRDYVIRPGEMVVIDWGAQLDGYCSDCTRTIAAGEPTAHAREIYELVLKAQLAGLGAVRAGQSGRDADSVARDLIEAAGHGQHFGHGLGHGVGLAIHEPPRLSQRSHDQLQAGSIVTVEPGVYLPGELGVRIEDLVVVRDDGYEIITTIGKELTVAD